MTREHVCALLHRNIVPTESHNDGQNASYFLRTLQTVLLALSSASSRSSSEPRGCCVETHTFGVYVW
jgi:hypothetical protein